MWTTVPECVVVEVQKDWWGVFYGVHGNLRGADVTLEIVREEKAPSLIEQAAEVIEFLNAKVGRRYPVKNPRGTPTANADVVMARLKEGYTVGDCRAVIASKFRAWGHDEKMAKYLRPSTLFSRSHFETYLGELDA